jgi:hypothetical protein
MRLNQLSREYEARHYPPTRRMDLQREGPATARQRALHWIQSFAHEQPGADLLLIVDRGVSPGRGRTPVRMAVEKLLDEFRGGLIEWWSPFAEGSLAVRISADPHRWAPPPPRPEDPTDGRSDETAGRAWLPPEQDIPEELLPLARRTAELRRTREGQAVGLMDVVLREIWIEAQVAAMTERIDWSSALHAIARREEAWLLEAFDEE